jgi:hypothetical protein
MGIENVTKRDHPEVEEAAKEVATTTEIEKKAVRK